MNKKEKDAIWVQIDKDEESVNKDESSMHVRVVDVIPSCLYLVTPSDGTDSIMTRKIDGSDVDIEKIHD